MSIISKVIAADHFASYNSLQLNFTDMQVPFLKHAGSASFAELNSDIFPSFMKQT